MKRLQQTSFDSKRSSSKCSRSEKELSVNSTDKDNLPSVSVGSPGQTCQSELLNWQDYAPDTSVSVIVLP